MKKITSLEAIELNQNFVKTRTKAIDGAIGKKDALSCWFTLDELKEYIAFVEDEGKTKGIPINGLRIYFGAYSNKIADVSKHNLATVFLVPTQSKVSSLQKSALATATDSSDVTAIDGLNGGGLGFPPSATYPQY